MLNEALDPVLRKNRKEILKLFSDLRHYSKWNAEHSIEVARLLRDFAKAIGFKMDHLEFAAISHDVGKVKIRKDVLHKPGKLSDEERKHMNTHVVSSSELLQSVIGIQGKIARLAAEHHHTLPQELDILEKHNKLTSEEVKFIKMLTICDIFEALTTKTRPYKESTSKSDALELMGSINIIDNKVFQEFKNWQLKNFTNEYR
jgi:putative nucleotidyltransferase with HDIG domain